MNTEIRQACNPPEEVMFDLRKLLSEALDDEIHEDVAIEAGKAFIHHARIHGVTVNQIMALHTVIAEPRKRPLPGEQSLLPPDTTPMPFGKYKGLPLCALVDREPEYCRWLLENVPKLSHSLRAYFTTKLGVSFTAPQPERTA